MTKITSRMLTLLLSFAMVFTSIGWLGSFEANAAEGQETLSIKVVDQNGDPVSELPLYVDNDDSGAAEFDPTNNSGETSHKFNWTVDGIYGEADKYEVTLSEDDAKKWEVIKGVSFSVVFDEATTSGYINQVNDADYDGSQVTMELKSKEEPVEPDEPVVDPTSDWTTDFDFTKDTTYDWAAYGVDYTSINFDKDLIVDVRNIDFNKDPHFVYSNPDAADVKKAEGVTEDVAKQLDSALEKAKSANKKVVLICYGGMTYAKMAMQYYNTKGETLGPDGNVTYLKGGANGVTKGDYKANLGIGFNEITSNDLILDVRSKENFDKGHLPGAIHVDVTDEGGKLSDKDKSDMAAAVAKVPNGARLVIVCNSGNLLAYRAMSFFMADKTDAGLDNLKKVSYLIGGDKVIPADKKVTTEEENTPAITDGQTAVVDGATVQVLSASAKTAVYVKAPNKKNVTVPATVSVNGQTLDVVQIGPKAFTGKKIRKATVGANVSKIAKNAFKGSKATKMVVKSKKLKKASVKGSLKGSKIKTVQVKVGKKKDNKKYVKKYKKIFTKKNAGKKVKIR